MNEKDWLKQRCGLITASELNKIVEGKTKATLKGTLDYISKKRFERSRQFPIQVNARNFEIGNEQEPYIIGWLNENHPDVDIVFSKDFDEIPFERVDWAKFGASLDAWTKDEDIIIELKTLVGETNIYFFSDPTISYEAKRAFVLEEHGNQLKGQLLARPQAKEIWVVKYIYKDDFNELDTDPTTAEWRGQIFKFKREDFGNSIEDMKDRIIIIDKFIDSGYNREKLKDLCCCKDEVTKEITITINE